MKVMYVAISEVRTLEFDYENYIVSPARITYDTI